ncbi:hypothetical protein AVEN_253179-1, partial [Araneus ventricosus]
SQRALEAKCGAHSSKTVEAPFRVISLRGFCGKEKFSLHGKLPDQFYRVSPGPLSLTSRPDAPDQGDQSRSFAAEFLKRKFKLSVGRITLLRNLQKLHWANERRLRDRLGIFRI